MVLILVQAHRFLSVSVACSRFYRFVMLCLFVSVYLNWLPITVVEKTKETRHYVKSENQLLLCENLGLKKKFIPHLKALNVSFNLKYQTLQKL